MLGLDKGGRWVCTRPRHKFPRLRLSALMRPARTLLSALKLVPAPASCGLGCRSLDGSVWLKVGPNTPFISQPCRQRYGAGCRRPLVRTLPYHRLGLHGNALVVWAGMVFPQSWSNGGTASNASTWVCCGLGGGRRTVEHRESDARAPDHGGLPHGCPD